MSTDTLATLTNPVTETEAESPSTQMEWGETALTALFAAVAILFVSFFTVVIVLV